MSQLSWFIVLSAKVSGIMLPNVLVQTWFVEYALAITTGITVQIRMIWSVSTARSSSWSAKSSWMLKTGQQMTVAHLERVGLRLWKIIWQKTESRSSWRWQSRDGAADESLKALTRPFNIVSLNYGGVRTKLNTLRNVLATQYTHVYCMQETWLS